MSQKPTSRQFYNLFCDSLINANGLETDPKTRKEAKAMYSYEEYMSGGAYEEDVQSWYEQQRRQRARKETERVYGKYYTGVQYQQVLSETEVEQ